jgi:ascorbate-specific PTS system EIIC-type component UlaA
MRAVAVLAPRIGVSGRRLLNATSPTQVAGEVRAILGLLVTIVVILGILAVFLAIIWQIVSAMGTAGNITNPILQAFTSIAQTVGSMMPIAIIVLIAVVVMILLFVILQRLTTEAMRTGGA